MVSLCLLGLCSCFDMDKYPEGELSSVNSFTSTTEITKNLNQFYESTLKINDKDVANSAIKEQSNSIGNPTGSAFGDLNSDNMQSNVIDTSCGRNHFKFRCRINRVLTYQKSKLLNQQPR